MRNYPKLTVTEKAEKLLRGGHVWVYGDEITAAEGTPEDGALTDVFSGKGKYLGTGFYNSHSKIRVRIISKNTNDTFDEKFWERRLTYAVAYRKTVMGDTDFRCCRLIFGEADQFPGLTVDRFDNILVAEVLSLGIEKIKGMLFPALVRILREMGEEIDGIYERNDSPIRKLEGMETECGFFPLPGLPDPESGEVTITENGIRYFVDVVNGQKTGFFLDQKYNRRAIRQIARSKRVLDCFTHTGSFGLNAAAAGALHVTSVDISADAIAMAKRNAKENGLDGRMDFMVADVFDLLSVLQKEKKSDYDFIILNLPPSPRAAIRSATRSRATGRSIILP